MKVFSTHNVYILISNHTFLVRYYDKYMKTGYQLKVYLLIM